MNKYNVKKKLIFLSLAMIGMFLASGKALAITDKIEINCNPGLEAPDNCDVTPSNVAPLFDENDYPLFDLKPGDEIHREIIVHNNREETCYFTLIDATKTHDTETPPGSGDYFSDRLETIITDGTNGTPLISFSALFALSDIYLTELAPSQSKTLDWDVFFDANAGNEYQNARLVFDFTWNFQCGEEPPQTALNIFKTNDKLGITQEPGAEVTYTIEVSTGDFPVFNVIVLDLPPGGFTYRPGTWTATSDLRGNLVPGTTTEPTYSSPGQWNLGDMAAEEKVTLTYVTDISTSQQPGTYKDIAWTEGTQTADSGSGRVLGTSTIDNTTFFVGTAAIVDQKDLPEVQVEPEKKVIEITEGDVLGISLPATGADNIWMFIIVNLFGAGFIFTLTGLYLKRAHEKSNQSGKAALQVLILLTAALVFTSKAYAANLLIRLEEPKDPNNLDSLDLNFVTLDIENRTVTVKCYKKGPGDAVFSQFGGNIVTIPGGDDGYCPVNSSILSGMGAYKFYATADAGADPTETSQTVTIQHDDQRPGKPHNLNKDKNGSCKYDISFTTDNDGGDTVRVEVYRSDDKQFYVNSSTKFKDIAVGSDTDVDFTTDRPTCGRTYYYAVRAFDAAGNGSKVLVEDLGTETVTVITDEGTTTKETVFGEIIQAIAAEGSDVGVGAGAEEETPAIKQGQEGADVLGAEEQAQQEEGLLARLFSMFKWPVIILLALIIFLYVKKKLNKNRKPQQPQQF